MIILLKIAFRNIIANKKRSILIGTAIFFSSMLMLIADSIMNGGEIQTLRGYINIQSGNVIVVWEDLKKISNMNPSRLFDMNSFDVDKNTLNRTAIAKLNSFLELHRNEIKYYFPVIRRWASIHAGGNIDGLIINGLTKENKNLLIGTETLKMEEGVLLSEIGYGICVSKEIADSNKIKLGDTVTISATSPYGGKNMLDFIVSGIYANGAGYDNMYGFISDENALELFDFDPGYFDMGRIFLKNPDDSLKFAADMDRFLLSGNSILRAESSAEASAFYTNFSRNMKFINNLFVIFLLIMIAIGLRATIKMNLFERMKEFGTIRAIGFSRMQNYAIIFFEIFFLSLISLALALISSCVFVLVFGKIGIYVGSGPQSYTFGGEVFYPKMIISDVLFTFIVMIIFSLLSTFSPGMKISFQRITDLLLKRQRKVYLTGIMVKSLFALTGLKYFKKGI